jgi:DNA-binding CsgD family transcriptional regulator
MRLAMRTSVPVGAAVPLLTRWGVSCDADMVFRTLATLGPRSAPDLVAELGLPVRRIDAALGELRALGAVRAVTASRRAARQTSVWAPHPPAEVVAMLQSRRLRPVDPTTQAQAHHRAVRSLADHAGDVSGLVSQPGPVGGERDGGVRYLDSRARARDRLAELMAVECREHLTINTEQAFDAVSARVAAPLDRQIVQRGIRLRVIGLPPADQDLHVGADLLRRPGCTYREALQVPLKLVVVDHRVALFPADPADLDRGYLEVSQSGVVRALVMLFEHHWANAVDPREQGVPEIMLSDRERELVRLLAEGHTDVSAAAQLRISSRSVTNIMRALMDRCGVDNRFQLGLALGAARVALPPDHHTTVGKES